MQDENAFPVPGLKPWELDRSDEPWIVNQDDIAICEIHRYSEGSVLSPATEEDRLFYARVLTQAPKMLAVLTRTAAALEEITSCFKPESNVHRSLGEAKELLREIFDRGQPVHGNNE